MRKIKEFFNDLIDVFFEILKLIIDNINNTTMTKKEENKENSLNPLYEKIGNINAFKVGLGIGITLLVGTLGFIITLLYRIETNLNTKIDKVETNLKTEIGTVKTDIKKLEYIAEKNHIETSFNLGKITEDYKKSALENLKIKYDVKD